MHRGLLRLTIAPGLPPLIRRLPEGAVLAPFGRWLRERVASAIPDWPAVGFHRIEITSAGMEVLLVAGHHARAEAQFAAVLQAVWRDTTRGAVRCGWTRGDLWESGEIFPSLRRAQPRPSRPRILGADAIDGEKANHDSAAW